MSDVSRGDGPTQQQTAAHRPMPGRYVGSVIAAGFGLVYVFVNSWPLAAAWAWTVRGVAIVVAAATVVSIVAGAARASRRPNTDASGDGTLPQWLARGYWAIVLAEVVALFGGLAIINNIFDAPHAGVAWVSVVVGVHFLPMAHVFRLPFFHVIGVLIGACGIVGLVCAAVQSTGSAAAIVAGVVPGIILLVSGLWGATRRPQPGV